MANGTNPDDTSNPNGTPAAPDLTDVFAKAGVTPADAVDSVLLGTPQTTRGTAALASAYYGINHRQTPAAIPINKDVFGLTFFTRPNLNLTLGNLRAVRLFNPLTTTNQYSLQRIIRCYLDPRSNQGANSGQASVDSPMVDPQQAFIPILTNTLMSISGWPDVIVPHTASHEGVYKEVFGLVDGVTEFYGAYDITANFRNIPGDPVTALFLYWAHYMSNVYKGDMMPYPDMIVENEIDYQTRIYRLVLDPTKTKVQKIAACGAAFPTASPMGGNSFNYDSEKPYNQSNEQISIPFECFGAIYQDPILLYTFNQTVCAFNDTMADQYRGSHYTKVPMGALGIFNNQGYPRIDPDTWELEWWVSNDLYKRFLPWMKTSTVTVNRQTFQQVTPNVTTLTTGATPASGGNQSTESSSSLYTSHNPPSVDPTVTGTAIRATPSSTNNA
jgi:hypothetical protein